MRLPTLADTVFSLKAFAAGMLALYLAFSLDLPRPYWALLTTYIVAQPFSGMTRSKALYRFLGTFIGAAATVILVPACVNAPELLSLALALWIAFCLYLSLLQPPPRNYAFLLSGYTTALIGFPSVGTPDAVFQTALARVEEISIGILCAWLVGELIFPRRVGPLLQARLDAWLAAGATWATDVLQGRETATDRRRLAVQATELSVLRVHAAYDSPDLRAADDAAQALYDRMRMLMPILSGLTDRLRVLAGENHVPQASLRLLVDWLSAGPHGRPGAAFPIRNAIAAAHQPEESLVCAGTLARLDELARLWHECLVLRQYMLRGMRAPEHRRAMARDRHHDHGMAALSAVAAVVATLLCCAIWIATAWADGATMAMMAAVLCTIFAAQDDPAPTIVRSNIWQTVGALLAGVWLFAVLPAIDGFPLLAFCFALVLIPAGLAVAIPALAGKAFPFIFGFTGLIAIQETYAADFSSWVNGAIAQAAGLWIAALTTRLIRSVGAGWSVRRLLAGGRAELARIARGTWMPEPAGFAARMLDRIGAMATRLAASQAGAGPSEDEALADLRAGLNLLTLRRTRPSLTPHAGEAVDLVLETLARHLTRGPTPVLRRRIEIALTRLAAAPRSEETQQAVAALETLARHLTWGPPPALRRRIEVALARLVAAPRNEETQQAAVALDGLRRALFRDAGLTLPPIPEPLEMTA